MTRVVAVGVVSGRGLVRGSLTTVGVVNRLQNQFDCVGYPSFLPFTWGESVSVEVKGTWLLLKGSDGAVPKEDYKVAAKFWQDLFEQDRTSSPGQIKFAR